MKKQFGIFVVVALVAHTVVASSYYGGYGGYPYGGFQFPGFDDDEQDFGQMPGKTTQQPTEPNKTQPNIPDEPVQPQTYEQKHPRLILMFTKDECGYCRYMKPIMEDMAAKYGKDITFMFVDVVQNPQYAKQYKFETVPQIMYFKDGERLDVHGSGNKTMTHAQVEAKIKQYFGSENKPVE